MNPPLLKLTNLFTTITNETNGVTRISHSMKKTNRCQCVEKNVLQEINHSIIHLKQVILI